MTWKTMETAPKDGTRLILWVPKTNKGIVVGRWVSRWVTCTKQMEGWELEGFDLLFDEVPYLPVLWTALPARPLRSELPDNTGAGNAWEGIDLTTGQIRPGYKS